MTSTLDRLTACIQTAVRRRDAVSTETYRLMKAHALELALAENRHTVREVDLRASLLAWRAHLLQLMKVYVSYGAQGEGHSDRLVSDVAHCDEVLGPEEPPTAELLRLQRAAELALRTKFS